MRNLAKYAVFVDRRFWQVFGKFWKFGLAKIASFLLFHAVVRNGPKSAVTGAVNDSNTTTFRGLGCKLLGISVG